MTQAYNNLVDNKGNKNNFLTSYLKWSLKNSIPKMIIVSVILFVIYFYQFFVMGPALTPMDWPNSQIFSLTYFPILAVMFIYTFSTCLNMCSYLHNKRSCDAFMSFPVSKTTLFFTHYITGLVTISIPLIVSAFIGINVLSLLSGLIYSPIKLLGDTFVYLLYLIVAIALFYTFSMMLGLLCGKKSTYILSILSLNLLFFFLLYLLDFLYSSILPSTGLMDSVFLTSLAENSSIMYILTLFLAPLINIWLSFILPINFLGDYRNFNSLDSNYLTNYLITIDKYTVLFNLFAITVFLIITYFIAKKRKSQYAQTPFAFSIIPVILKSFTAFLFSIIGLYIIIAGFNINTLTYRGDINPVLVFIISLIILAALSISIYLLITLISKRGKFDVKKHIAHCLVVAIITVSTFSIFATGLFGTNTQLPQEDEIDRIIVNLIDYDFIQEAGQPLYISYSYGYSIYSSMYYDKDEIGVEGISEIVELNDMIIDATIKNGIYPYTFKSTEFDSGEESRCIEITYYLEDGNKVEQVYNYRDILNSNASKETKDEIMSMISEIEKEGEYENEK